jgi:hypothetical protein
MGVEEQVETMVRNVHTQEMKEPLKYGRLMRIKPNALVKAMMPLEVAINVLVLILRVALNVGLLKRVGILWKRVVL